LPKPENPLKPREELNREPLNSDVFDPNPRFPNEDPDPNRDPAKDELPNPPERELAKPDAPLDRPNECQPPSDLPALREKLEFDEPPKLRPPLKREELPELPKECQWPSLIAAWEFEERFPDDEKPRPAPNPAPFRPLMPRDPLNPPDERLFIPK
jgi:hypothetical protein